MSMRTLIELNHDYSENLTNPEFLTFLGRYLASGDERDANILRRFGAAVIGMRHHSANFVIDADTEGFPPTYLDERGRKAANDASATV